VMAQVKERLNAGFGDTLAGAGKALGETVPTATAASATPGQPNRKEGPPNQQDLPDSQQKHPSDGGKKKGAGKVKMPAESLSSGNMLFLMNKEIKRNLRYKSPFSTLIVSIEKVATDGGEQRPLSTEDTEELLPQLFKHVQALLRDVDMIGTIGAEETAAPELFILLPMVGAEGTETVKGRIVKTASEGEFERAGRKAAVEVKVSAAAPGEDTKDLKSYLRAAMGNHEGG